MRTKTYSPKAADLRPQWHVIDASSEPLGRLASRIAQILKGKNTPLYSPHMNTGDFVIVTNTKQVVVTGRKKEKKVYYRHTQYPGGLRETSLARMSEQHPNRVVFKAVKGMLPHNRLGRAMLRRLKLYSDAEHPHEAQVSASIKAAEKAEAEGPVYIGLPKPVIRRKPKKKRAKAPAVEAAAETAVAVPEGEETPVAEAAADAATGEVVSEPAVEEAPAEDAEAAAAPVDEAPGPVEEEGQESPAADEAPSDAAEPMAEPEPAEEPAEAAVVEQPEATSDEAPVAEEQAIEEPESAAEEQEKASETEDKKAPE